MSADPIDALANAEVDRLLARIRDMSYAQRRWLIASVLATTDLTCQHMFDAPGLNASTTLLASYARLAGVALEQLGPVERLDGFIEEVRAAHIKVAQAEHAANGGQS